MTPIESSPLSMTPIELDSIEYHSNELHSIEYLQDTYNIVVDTKTKQRLHAVFYLFILYEKCSGSKFSNDCLESVEDVSENIRKLPAKLPASNNY